MGRKALVTGASRGIGAAIAVCFAIVQLVPGLAAMDAMGSEAFLLLSLWCLLGFVFYWRTVNHSTLTEYSGMSASGIVLFSLLIYSSLMWLLKRLMQEDSVETIRATLPREGLIVLLIVFAGLVIMLYVQDLVRKKHEESERDKIRAVESSLAKSQFLFNMSHDIRTPMNAIVGFTDLASAHIDDTDQVRDYLGKISVSSEHLLSLINNVLDMSRIESGKLNLEYAPEDLCAIFEGIRELFYEQMKQKNMDFSVHASQIRNRFVWCDKKNLNRILLNLLGNAFKFTKERGEISASIWEIGSENGYGSYEIRIRDNGIGMSQAFAEKMFTAFERERTSTVSGIEGTGLGLSITKSLVDMMGGSIEVLTTLGSGTEFIIRLKFKLADAADIKQADPSEHTEHQKNAVAFGGKRLLLVDDNAINLEIAQILLEQMGFAVDTAENGKIAVDKVAASAPGHYDAVLMDIQMPVMDGYEAAHAIRNLDDRALASIPIIAMTANAFAEDVRAAEEAGMQGHIAKPIDVDVMTATLLHVLDGQKA